MPDILDVPLCPDFELPSNVHLTIRFGPHLNGHDLGTDKELAAMIKATDILALEIPGWDEWLMKQYNKVATGRPQIYRNFEIFDTDG